jgi:murein DD-endopeptidase MepM/ murein hydrolase activator NlpD
MRGITNRIYKYLFPKRQFIIRQNGEIRYIKASSEVQFSLVLLIASIFVWLSFSSLKYFSLNDKVLQSQEELYQSQASLDQLALKYQVKQVQMQQQLLQVQEQQQLLQNVLDSLPAAISDSEQETVGQTSDADAADIDVSSETTSKTDDPIWSVMQKNQTDIARLKQLQQFSYAQLEQQISKRKYVLDQAMILAGVSSEAMLKQWSATALGQGGPLNQVLDEALGIDNKNLIQKLLNLTELEAAMSNIPAVFPAKDYYISSLFGIRKDPMLKHPAMHKGIDMAGWIKTEIFSAADGTIRQAGRNGSYGRFVEIDHHNGFMTRFGHLYKIKVKKGQKISKDDVVGLMGSSGRSTSTHLHYEVLFDKKQINPIPLIKAFKDVL